MGLVGFVLRRPVTVAVGVVLLVLFGLIGLGAIPVQLVPDVDQPIITVPSLTKLPTAVATLAASTSTHPPDRTTFRRRSGRDPSSERPPS